MDPVDLSDPPASVLVVVAHPDDIDFGTAGTMAALARAGSRITYCLATCGEAGPPEDMDRAELARIRQAEQRAAADAVGVTDLVFLGLPDGRLVPDLALRRDISRVIRQVRPDLVVAQNPQRRWDRVYASHPDHLAVAEATMAAVYPDARNPHAHPELLAEGLEPHAVPEVWVVGLEPADVVVDITDVFAQKVAALSSHRSQTAWIDDIHGLLLEWAESTARAHGLADGRLAEAFRRVSTA
ncbi:MAG: PIG-L family deacetylase [Acidimicrobiales bacterium]|nr:PIG-L family deacetylase [Acidimicrobiales bacterium]